MMNFARPNDVSEALSLLASDDWIILSGGTDFYPALGDRQAQSNILDLSHLHALKQITQDNKYWIIGAGTTWTDIIRSDLPEAFEALKLAAKEVGSIQIQNRATVAGNLCNASPAADGVPPLLCLDAKVKLSSLKGERILPLAEFILGNRVTALQNDELLTQILIPKQSAQGLSSFLKLGSRKYLVISISMVAARINWNKDGLIDDAAIVVGSCSQVAQRLHELEAALIGQKQSVLLGTVVKLAHLHCLSPIDDVRASANYRIEASAILVARVLSRLGAA